MKNVDVKYLEVNASNVVKYFIKDYEFMDGKTYSVKEAIERMNLNRGNK